eukprot:02577.XXX_41276_41380_1 [CDS] Oithona nana genome sequencing.
MCSKCEWCLLNEASQMSQMLGGPSFLPFLCSFLT